MSLKINILQCHHKESEYLKNKYIQPIHVGSALSDRKLDYCIRDDEGENISHKNPYWCELTALYWQWKNVDADYYGLFHYRRLMTFSEGGGLEDNLKYEVQKKYNLLNEKIINASKDYDIILPKKEKIYSFCDSSENISLIKQYELDHHISDLELTFEIVRNKYPKIAEHIQDLSEIKSCYFGNIFLMKKKYYLQYCEFLFNVLFDLELIINISEYDNYQKRVFGFISERLLNLYIIYLLKTIKVNIKEYSLLYLSNPRPLKIKIPIKVAENQACKEVINVCMAFDDNYFDHGMVVIKSISENTQSLVKIFVLDGGGISEKNRIRCLKEYEDSNIKIEFIKIDDSILNQFPLNMGYISIATYYRLLLVEIFKNTKKIIYLDSDIIVNGDISDLWGVDLNNKSIGACYDELGVYQERRLGLDGSASYFNAGVMIFDILNMKNKYKDLFGLYKNVYDLNKEKILYQDQDILNLAHVNDVYIIESRWNMGTGMFLKNINDVKYTQNCIEEWIKDPGIIHFTGGYKPWNFFSNNPVSYLYWSYFRKIKLKNWSLLKFIRHLNNSYIRLGYSVNGEYVNFHMFNKELFRLKKKLLLMVRR